MGFNYWQKLEPDGHYHIYNRVISQDLLFVRHGHYAFFLRKWLDYLPYLQVYAYCLLPNHFHFLVKVKPLDAELLEHVKAQKTSKSRLLLDHEDVYPVYLEDQFKRLFSSYALAFNHNQKRRGSLFQKRFKRILVTEEWRLHYLLLYIHHNPIKHFLCQDFDDWPYSSWMAYQVPVPEFPIQINFALEWLGIDKISALEAFRDAHQKFKQEFQHQFQTLET